MTPAACEEFQTEIDLLRNENDALQHLLEVHEVTLVKESQRLEDALALLTHEQHLLYARIQQHADYDALTGLPNRTSFVNSLVLSLERAHLDSAYQFAVLSINLDRFRLINDGMGRSAGDQLLQSFAKRLVGRMGAAKRTKRDHEEFTIARLSGDEFGVLFHDIRVMIDGSEINELVHPYAD